MQGHISAFFTGGKFFSLAALLASGYLGQRDLQLFAITFPGVLIGFWLSGKMVNRMAFAGLRPVILGIAALIRGVMSL